MTQTENQQPQSEPNLSDRIKSLIEMYLDIAIRGFLSFVVVIIFMAILQHYVKMNITVMLIITFILSILLAPLYSKVKLAKFFLTKYVEMLDRMFKK